MNRYICLITILCSLFFADNTTCASEAIAVWAYPDSASIPYRDKTNRIIQEEFVHIGVVAYHHLGIDRVEFTVEGTGLGAAVTSETINPHTDEYEYVFELNPSDLQTDGEYIITATAYPKSGDPTHLPDLKIQKDTAPHNILYVGAGGYSTIHAACMAAGGGDIIKIRDGTYDFPNQSSYGFTKYVTIMPDEGAGQTVVGGGALRSSFLKFKNVTFHFDAVNSGIAASSSSVLSHYWFDKCTFIGIGKIYWDNEIHAIASRNNSGFFAIENSEFHDVSLGTTLVGNLGNHIFRNNHVHEVTADGVDFGNGSNILITNNVVEETAAPAAWSVSQATASTYDFGSGMDLVLHLTINKGSDNYPYRITVTLAGVLSANDIAARLNSNAEFNAEYEASISQAPYPHPGNVVIRDKTRSEYRYFYIDGLVNNILKFSDNSYELQDISIHHPAKNGPQHADFIADNSGNTRDLVLRNNRCTGDKGTQGMKFDAIGSIANENFYKENVAFVNNLFAGTINTGRLLYLRYRGSGNPQSRLHFRNILIEHNTFFKTSEEGSVRTALWIELGNDNLQDMFVRNNIIGVYNSGDWDFDNDGDFGTNPLGISDYNLFYPSRFHPGNPLELLNSHSLIADPLFTDSSNMNFRLPPDSPAVGLADNVSGIFYDISWKRRDGVPDAGCHEFPIGSLPEPATQKRTEHSTFSSLRHRH